MLPYGFKRSETAASFVVSINKSKINVQEHSWFAAKTVKNRPLVRSTVQRDGVKTYIAPVVPNILFLYCTKRYLETLIERCPGALFFYRDPERKEPQAIDERQMRNFMLVTSAPEESLIALDEVDREFLQGQRVRVTGGIFEGVEGVVKRVKGDRRLIVSITGIDCVATAFIHPALLEPVPDDPGGGK